MVKSFRKSLIGLLCLSLVGCANMNDDNIGTAGMVVVGLGALAALILLSDSDDDKQEHKSHSGKDNHKGGHGKGPGKDRPGRH